MLLVGHWLLEMKTPFGIQRLRMDIWESDGIMSGTLENQLGTFALESVQLKADAMLLRAGVKMPFGDIRLEFQGVVRNNKMWGKCKTPFGRNDFMGERQV